MELVWENPKPQTFYERLARESEKREQLRIYREWRRFQDRREQESKTDEQA